MNSKPHHWRQSSQVFDERAAEYDSWFDNNLLFAIELAAIQALHISFTAPTLEVGVGPGRFAEALGISVGLDPAVTPLRLAQHRGIQGCQAAAESLPFRSNSLNAVCLFFTLCFLCSPQIFFRDCRRVLRHNAPLVVGFVPANGIWGRTLLQKKRTGHPFYENARFFTVALVQILLEEQGFQVLRGVSTLYQPPSTLSVCEQPHAGLDEQAGFVVLEARPR